MGRPGDLHSSSVTKHVTRHRKWYLSKSRQARVLLPMLFHDSGPIVCIVTCYSHMPDVDYFDKQETHADSIGRRLGWSEDVVDGNEDTFPRNSALVLGVLQCAIGIITKRSPRLYARSIVGIAANSSDQLDSANFHVPRLPPPLRRMPSCARTAWEGRC